MIWKIAIVLILVAAVIGLGIKIKHDIYKDGYKTCEADISAAQEKANEKVVVKKKVIKHETQSLDRIDIIKQLCAGGWVRDKSACPTN